MLRKGTAWNLEMLYALDERSLYERTRRESGGVVYGGRHHRDCDGNEPAGVGGTRGEALATGGGSGDRIGVTHGPATGDGAA